MDTNIFSSRKFKQLNNSGKPAEVLYVAGAGGGIREALLRQCLATTSRLLLCPLADMPAGSPA